MDYKSVYTKLFSLIKSGKNKEFIAELNKVKDNVSFDINVRDNNNKYFLDYGITSNNIEIVDLLIKSNARLDIGDDTSILSIPILYSYDDMLKLLLNADEKNVGSLLVGFRDKQNRIPLHYAIKEKNISAINLLLKHKSNTNAVDKEGYNALFHAVKSRSFEVCKIILPHIININAKSLSGENVLHIASNLKLYDIAELLVESKININAIDSHEITPLHYSILMNDKKLVELLIKNGANPNVQDVHGNTPLHYVIIEKNYEILSFLLTFGPIQNIIIFNLWNIEGSLPFHLFLKENGLAEEEKKKYFNIFIENTNLNIQNKNGISCLYLLVQNDLWKKYTDLLVKKKLDIFLKDKDNNNIIGVIPKKDYEEFMNLVVDSYMYNLKHLDKSWTEDLDKKCGKNNIPDTVQGECRENIRLKIERILKETEPKCYEKSYPMTKPVVCVTVSEGSNLNFCTFTGSILDILFGLIYLLKSHKNVCSILSDNVDTFYETCKTLDKNKCELLNFEVIWSDKKLSLGKNFAENFQKCMKKKRFTMIPLGIEMVEGNHSSFLIYDSVVNEIERFETYGGGMTLYGTFYNPELLDMLLESKFKEIDENIVYVRPYDFLPKIGFQLFDIIEKKKRRIGDPIGFCSVWSLWWIDMRLTYYDIKRRDLAKILIDIIKRQNISFKNMIRNYSAKIIKIRDELLSKAKMNINDWINEQYNKNQYTVLLENIYVTLSKLKK